MTIPQTHHGLCVADIDAARAALPGVGFTAVQPNAPEPLRYADEPDDVVGQLTCPDLGSPYRTHYVEHPGTHHQIDLIEIDPTCLADRPGAAPVSGDLTVVMPVPGQDPDTVRRALRPFFGDRLVVTPDGEPWATLHLAAEPGDAAVSFLTDVLDVPLAADGDRCTMVGVGGRIDVDVSASTAAVPAELGKRYPGANHLRLLHRDLAAIDARLADRADARWILPPSSGFAFIAGPGGMTIEMFDRSITGDPS